MDKIYENRNIKNLDREIWKDIEGYNGDYQVSNFGRIKSFKYDKINGKILKQRKSDRGYLFIRLCENKPRPKYIHILEFEIFNNYKLKKNECVHHINKNKLDNDLNNFKLMTDSEHISFHNKNKIVLEKTKKLMSEKMSGKNNPNYGTKRPGDKSGCHILTEKNVVKIKILLTEGKLTQKEIAKMFGVKENTISNIKTGKSWKHLK